MPDPKLYRNIPVASLPDADWVSTQSIPADAVNIYSLWPGRACVELTAVWWNANALPAGKGAAVYDAGVIGLQPIENKSIHADDSVLGIGAFSVFVNATDAITAPAFVKQSLIDTSADTMYVRVASAVSPPFGATHLRVLAEVTP